MNKINPKDFAKKFKKSLDFRTATSSIDPNDQILAETNMNESLVNYIKSCLEKEGEIFDVPMAKGTLKVNKLDLGLYSGVMVDSTGQVIDKFNEMTPEMMAKNLAIKGLDEMIPETEEEDDSEVEDIGEESEEESEDESSEEMSKEDMQDDDEEDKTTQIIIRMEGMEIEIRKSIHNFVKSFKKSKLDANLMKALKSLNTRLLKSNEKEAAKELIENWEMHKEDFIQRLHGISIKNRNK